MDIRKFRANELNPAAYNPRKNLKPGDKEYEKIKASIERFGFVEPLVVNVRGGLNRIVGGHQRYKVLVELGVVDIDCVVMDCDEQTEKACNIALNKVGGEWDFSTLADLLGELNTGAFDMELTGFSGDELSQMMGKTLELTDKYTQKIKPPIYEPTGDMPDITELYDDSKTKQLLDDINKAKIPEPIKQFLNIAAQRHTSFHFGNIAEYYCHADASVKELIEQSGMVIIDYNKAVENGFVQLITKLETLSKEESND